MGRFRRRPETGLEVHVGKGKGKANAMGRDGSEGSKGSGSTRRGWRRGGCRAIALLAWILALAPLGCGGGSEGGGPTDASSGCHSDLECSDGIFCNGSEICLPGAAGADALGCLPAPSPRCLASQQCDEASLRCLTRCELEGDADGDGHDDPACGGDDCDDADPDRYPGNLERCDAEHLDEDCDPSTLGGPSDGDADGDGFVSAACCNWMGSELRCGDDCDDAAASVNPDAAEICNGIDEDCDGALDEGVYQTFFVDTDGDGYGDPALRHWGPCVPDPLLVDTASDCDDTDPAIHPGVPELCDGIDNDCDGIVEIDADEDGFVRAGAACTGGTLGVGDCNDTERSINPGAEERCDGFDNDCDAAIDQRPAADASCASGLAHTSAICHEATCAISACEDGWR
ncbi:MAG: putative metal-binding motif-containing protein, partial [Myxococcales bacterium]|nr:putative metal-binding motif-containing protein [Myxococcales bacterium]